LKNHKNEIPALKHNGAGLNTEMLEAQAGLRKPL